MTFSAYCSMILQIGQSMQPQLEASDILGIAAGVFALILCSLSMYAWTRSKQPKLIIVASAFLLYFLKQVIELLAETYQYDPGGWPLLIFIDFAILTLIFIAIVIKPRRRSSKPVQSERLQ